MSADIAAWLAAYVCVGLSFGVFGTLRYGGWRLWGTPYWRWADVMRRLAGCAVFWPALVFYWLLDGLS